MTTDLPSESETVDGLSEEDPELVAILLTHGRPVEEQVRAWVSGIEPAARVEKLTRAYLGARKREEALEAALADARLWGFPGSYNWYEDVIEWLGEWHDEELCDGPRDLIAEVKARFAATLRPPREAEGRYREALAEWETAQQEIEHYNQCARSGDTPAAATARYQRLRASTDKLRTIARQALQEQP